MRAPISWLKEFVTITLDPKTLGDRLTEVGLGVEKIERVDGDVIFEFEVTPNRPDLLSIVGIAREIAAIEGKKVRLKTYASKSHKKNTLLMKLTPNYELFHRWTAISIANVTVKPSPSWMQKRLQTVGFRPINNIVDTTNYVMMELGMPLHAFDYDHIKGHVMTVEKTKGGERFTTVDEKTYALPKGAIIIKDKERIIDLAGIKGGLNSGITEKTKSVFLHVTIDNPILIRRASQALGLRSEASTIYERGPDKGGTVNAVSRAASLIAELAHGEIVSPIIDLKEEAFAPWTLKLSHEHLVRLLGLTIEPKRVKELLERLELKTTINHQQSTLNYAVTIPTYRNDLHIEEDLIEEVARLYGYNNFSKTIPQGATPTEQVPYPRDYQTEEIVKQLLQACGFSEISTYSLVSEADLVATGINSGRCLRVDNPVSREYEYLRPTLRQNLVKALGQNVPYASDIALFELGKVYKGKSIDEAAEEYTISGISNKRSFLEVKGILERLFTELGVDEDPSSAIDVLPEGVFFEVNFSTLIKKTRKTKTFVPLPKYPPVIEDLALTIASEHGTGDIIRAIKKVDPLIASVSLLDEYNGSRTFHIVYQHPKRNLTASDAATIRAKILSTLKQKFNARLKE